MGTDKNIKLHIVTDIKVLVEAARCQANSKEGGECIDREEGEELWNWL